MRDRERRIERLGTLQERPARQPGLRAGPEHSHGTLVDALRLDSLPMGSRVRLRLALFEDGCGFPVVLPIVVLRGRRPGPVLGVTCAVHGEEINGIPVVHHLLEKIDPGSLRGTLVAILVVNVPGFSRNVRKFLDGRDLNSAMPGDVSGSVSAQFARRLCVRVISHFDALVDLHTASRGRINSLYARCDMTDPKSARMAYLLRPQIIAHSPANDRTVRGAAMSMDIPAVTLEIGDPQRFQPELTRSSYLGLRAVMSDLGMVRARKIAEGPSPVLCNETFWTYTQAGGLLGVLPKLREIVVVDQPIARLTNIWGDLVHEYLSPADAIVIGKSINPVGYTGARIAHLGLVVPPGTPPFVGRAPRVDTTAVRQTETKSSRTVEGFE